MSHELPLPEAARPPYPLHPEPAAQAAPQAAPDRADAVTSKSEPAEAADRSWTDRARDTFDRATESKAALGAAVGIGSAALVAALLYARRSRNRQA